MNYTAEELAGRIRAEASGLRKLTVMEVCGTHSHSIRRWGLRQLLPDNITLVSGPGCPVCVTAQRDLSLALALAARQDTLVCAFGDMLRVPCAGRCLGDTGRAAVCLSPMDALRAAKEQPDTQVVWFAVGFETTTGHTAALLEAAMREGLSNLSVLCAHKTMPAALRALLGENRRVDALLCPGHVAAVTGAGYFRFLPEALELPAAVAGFSAEDILLGILALTRMARAGKPRLCNAYPRAVTEAGNAAVMALSARYFRPCPAAWRGLGVIADSGLELRPEYADYDARRRFRLVAPKSAPEPALCRCGDILRGLAQPEDCPGFGRLCTPEHPLGACMVSQEGSCAAAYLYGDAYGNR